MEQPQETQQLDLFSSTSAPLLGSPVYGLSKDALVEEVPGYRVVYGFWGHLFGCWRTDPDTGRMVEISPDWPVLMENGVWLPPDEVSLLLREDRGTLFARPVSFHAKAAFATFFDAIPFRVRALAARFKPFQWNVLDMMHQVPAFARFVDRELFDGREQYIHAALALAHHRPGKLTREHRRMLAKLIMTEKRHELLGRLGESRCFKSAVRALYKLDSGPHEPTIYLYLLHLMDNERSRKILCHAEHITAEILQALIIIPAAARLPNLTSILSNCEEGPLAMAGSIIETLEDTPEEMHERCIASLRLVKTDDGLLDWQEEWVERVLDGRVFPDPPIPGDDLLIPLTNAKTMREEGRHMNNCTGRLAQGVMEGEGYYYHWAGQQPATVFLSQNSQFGWGLEEVLSIGNKPVSHMTRLCIEERVYFQLGMFGLVGFETEPSRPDDEEDDDDVAYQALIDNFPNLSGQSYESKMRVQRERALEGR